MFYVDILVLEVGGNIIDAVSIAVKAALASTRIPKRSVTHVDGGEPEIEIVDTVGARGYTVIDVSNAPIIVTLVRIGNHCIVDPTPEEEHCSSASVVVAVTPDGQFSTLRKLGVGSFHASVLMTAVQLASQLGKEINQVLMKKIKQEEDLGANRKRIGFL